MIHLISSLATTKLTCDWCLNKVDENQKIESPFDQKVINLVLVEYFMLCIEGVLFLPVPDPSF